MKAKGKNERQSSYIAAESAWRRSVAAAAPPGVIIAVCFLLKLTTIVHVLDEHFIDRGTQF